MDRVTASSVRQQTYKLQFVFPQSLSVAAKISSLTHFCRAATVSGAFLPTGRPSISTQRRPGAEEEEISTSLASSSSSTVKGVSFTGMPSSRQAVGLS